MMPPPKTYAEWCGCLDIFAEGKDDESIMIIMGQGSIVWQSGVAERIAARVQEVVNLRLSHGSAQFQRNITNCSTLELTRSIAALRRLLFLVFRFAKTPAFEGQLQQCLCEQLDVCAARTQDSLEESAKADRSGALLALLRRNSLIAYKTLHIENTVAIVETGTKPSENKCKGRPLLLGD